MLRFGGGEIEFDGFGQIHLGDDGDVGGVEDGRIFERLVFAFGDRQQDQPQILAQIVGRGATRLPTFSMNRKSSSSRSQPSRASLNHRGFQMAERAGGDLLDGHLGARQADGVVVGGQIADQGRDAVVRAAGA